MLPGQVIADRFVLERLAASGGMGSVYRAMDRATGEPVAIKVIAPGGAHDLRFEREASLLASFAHPGIVRYVSHGLGPAGERYLAMEWLEGVDLAAALYGRGISMADGVRLVARVAEALGHAHARGVVHRDVKPSNLFLVGGDVGAAKVIDFGIARAADPGSVTRTGAILGTPGYLAPEQARGGASVGPAADVFSLGCVLFEVLTGRPPFSGDHFIAVLAKILAEDPPSARDLRADLPAELDALLARMLSKDPARRPPDGAAVASALLSLVDAALGPPGAPRAAPPPTLTAREQQLVSVILVAQDGGGSEAADAPTITTGDLGATLAREREVAASFGAVHEALLGGASLATLTRVGAATDHAVRAARCALSLRAVRPGAPVVLATGRATIADRLPLGAVIDRASEWLRRMRAAGDRALVVDEVTAGLLDGRFELRGAAGLPGFELLGEREAAPTARTLLGRPTSCVGRERELALLLGAWEASVEAPCAQAVLLTGAPGAGKSRLRGEFLRRLAERGAAPEVWIAAGDPVGAHSPLGLLSRWIRRAGGVLDGDRVELRRHKLRARLSRHLGGAELDRASAFLGELAGAPLPDEAHVELRAARRDPTLMGTQLRRAFGEWLAAESAAAPMVLVLEDLQWGDLASVRLIGSSLRALGDRPVMLLALARPELRDELPGALGEALGLTVALGPLPPRASERIAREALGDGVDAAVIARLVERSEGNPLYLEELVRAVADGRNDSLPETLLAMVSARLDRLDPQARRVLRAASVFGREFVDRGVAALLGGVDRTTQVGDRLRELVDAEVLVRRGEGYAFRHALLREASYALLTEADRTLGHQLAGRWLLESGEGDPASLAEHFARGGLRELAAQWFLRAAEQALDASALSEALAWAARAEGVGAEGEALGAVRRVEARARSLRDENAEAAAAGEEALSLLPRGSAEWHLAAADLATTALRINAREALVAIARDLGSAEALPGAAGSRAIALSRTAIHLIQTGCVAEVALLRAALDALDDPADDPAVRAWRVRLRAVEALRAGDPSAYRALTAQAAEEFERAGDRGSACAQRGNVGYALQELGDYAGAAEVMREALAQAEALGVHSTAGLIRHNLGLALAFEGALDEGRALEEEAVRGFVAQGHPRLEGFARAYLARIQSRAGEHEAAAREAAQAVALLGESEPSRAFALAVQAEALSAAGEAAEAREAAGEAAALLEKLRGIEEGEGLIRLMDAETRLATGDREGAARALAEASRRLHERAAKISDATLRASFLEGVPEHARTLSLRSRRDRVM